MRRALLYFLLVAFGFACVAFPQNAVYEQDPKWQAPSEAAVKVNPLANRPEAAAGGQKLYRRYCAECHGNTGQGMKKAADFHLPVVQQQTDGSLFWKITNGNPDRGMPSFSRLPELQRWQIVLYLRQLAPEAKASR
jgi:mono/diheme cytochrome c family protein